jgi:hypothetical protein
MLFKKSASSANRRKNSKAAGNSWSQLHSSTRSGQSSAGKGGRRKAKKPSKRELDDQTQVLHAEIGALEDFIAGSPFRDRRDRFRSRDTVPPPERKSSPAANRRRRGELTHREKATLRRERFSHLLTFVALFGAVCAMLYWLLQII